MPNVVQSIPKLCDIGPVLDIWVANAEARADGERGIQVKAIFDTGAPGIVMDETLLCKRLGIRRKVGEAIRTITGVRQHSKYLVALKICNEIPFEDIIVVGADLRKASVQCLLGRSVLHRFRFLYESPDDRYTLTWD